MKKIYSTKDYSRFSFLENNRIVKRSHVNEFKEEIKENDRTMCFPIVVDPNLLSLMGNIDSMRVWNWDYLYIML